jgi:hypothetical protein
VKPVSHSRFCFLTIVIGTSPGPHGRSHAARPLTTFWNSDNEDNTASAAAMKGGPKFPWEKAHLTVVLHRFRYGWNGLLALNTGRE